MKISTITVCFNSAKTIGHTIESFCRQDYRDKELIVVDGASRDDSVRIVESFGSPDIHIQSEADTGIYDAMNKGLKRFTGDAAGFLNSDDRYHDDTVLSAIAATLADADCTQGHLDFVSDHIQSRVVRRWRAAPRPASGFRSGWMPAHPTFYFRRHVYERVGLFNLAYPMAGDYDWMLRASELPGVRIATVDRVMVDMMIGGASTQSLKAYVQHNVESLRARRAVLGSGPVDAALFAKPLRKLGQFVRKGG